MKRFLGIVKSNEDEDHARKVQVHLLGLTDGIADGDLPWATPLEDQSIVPEVNARVWIYVDKADEEVGHDYSRLFYTRWTEHTFKEAYDYTASASYNLKNDALDTSGTIQEPALPTTVTYPKNRVIKISGTTIEFDQENNRFEITDPQGNYFRLGSGEVVIKATTDLYIMTAQQLKLKVIGHFTLEGESGNTFKSTATGFEFDSGGSPEKMVLGESLKGWISNFINNTYGTHMHGSAMGPTSPPMVPATPPQDSDMLSSKNKND